MSVAAISILTLTVGLSLSQPRIGRLHIHHSTAAIIGAVLTLALGLVPIVPAIRALEMLAVPVVTIVCLMVTTLIAERAGLFELVAGWIAHGAAGDGRKLFTRLFFAGTLVGTVFTNDAAVLIFTPLVVKLVAQTRDRTWTAKSEVAYFFAILYVANLVGALTISNPINIVVANLFGIGFLEYARWMVLPAVASIIVSYLGLRFVFRRVIPPTFEPLPPFVARNDARLRACSVVLGLTLLGFFTESWTGIPTWSVALVGAVTLLAYGCERDRNAIAEVFRGVGWDVIVFVIGIFIVALGMRNAGLTHQIGNLIRRLAGADEGLLPLVTSLVAGVSSSIMNNHPTADMMAWVIRDFERSTSETRLLALSALIGGDLGPKMLPIGSLAALIWFRLLRERGVEVPYSLYVKIGIPVTLTAIVLSTLVLQFEFWLAKMF